MNDLQQMLQVQVPDLDTEAMKKAQNRWNSRTKPPDSLGVLEETAVKIAGITGCCPPELNRPAAVIAAADHGVVSEGVSAFPQEVTRQMVSNFASGGAAANVLSKKQGAQMNIVDVGVLESIEHETVMDRRAGPGTENMARGPAMTEKQLEKCLSAGAEMARNLHAEGIDVVALGEMGIGNTTAASAITATVTGGSVKEVTGPGTGLEGRDLQKKEEVVRQVLKINQPDPDDATDILLKVGGFEIAFLTGFMITAPRLRLPVVLDGFICCSAALCAQVAADEKDITDYYLAGHLSGEPGHSTVLQALDLRPLLKLDMCLGEGSGAILALGVIQNSLALLRDMASFSEAAVSDKSGGDSE